ncbi:MAG TPA: pitrilysin family protein [Vicinamibacteria bacterium]|nr:pitrilysin family protein [Vicinamibacteria bacterium]
MNLAATGRRALVLSLLAAAVPLPAQAAESPRIDVEEFTLPNGMRWLLFERRESPTVVAGWVAHVGSVNEREGITGISHLFEHMMFKGTHTIGTRDIAADLRLLEEQETVRAEMRDELQGMRDRLRRGEIDDITRPENQTPRYRELEKQFDLLVQKQRETLVKDHLSQIYTKNGGEGLNAGTSEDWTIYFVRVPSNRLELWSWLESDRLINPVFREFYAERDVVYEERRMRTEATPLGKYDEAFNALFWQASPYKWPVIGWPSDVSSITKEQADAYFGTYYAPNNLTGVLVGDFDLRQVRPLLERYFGRIPRGKTEPPEMVTTEPPQLGEKRFHAEAETSPTVRVWWHAVPFGHKDRTVVDLVSDVLSGRTGRLYKGLVTGRQVANQVSAVVDLKKYEGAFQVEATVKEGQDPAAVERAIYEEMEKLKTEPLPAEELQKVKNQAKANAFRRLSSPFQIAIQLMIYDGFGDWRYINTYADEVDGVTAADIQRVANEHFTKENRTVGVFLRKESAAAEAAADPELSALPAPAQAMARQQISRIQAETDPAKLRQGLAEMEQAKAQVPAEMKPVLDLIVKRAQERLAALEGQNK